MGLHRSGRAGVHAADHSVPSLPGGGVSHSGAAAPHPDTRQGRDSAAYAGARLPEPHQTIQGPAEHSDQPEPEPQPHICAAVGQQELGGYVSSYNHTEHVMVVSFDPIRETISVVMSWFFQKLFEMRYLFEI